jgi:hypothetical protein
MTQRRNLSLTHSSYDSSLEPKDADKEAERYYEKRMKYLKDGIGADMFAEGWDQFSIDDIFDDQINMEISDGMHLKEWESDE